MATRTVREGVTQADFEEALAAFEADPTPENEAKALEVYEKVTGFRADCGDCLVKRAQFQRGLKAVQAGDAVEGLDAIAGAIRGAVAINLRKIFSGDK